MVCHPVPEKRSQENTTGGVLKKTEAMIILKLDGVPIPLARPRSFVKNGRVIVYDSQKQEKSWVQWKLIEQKRTEMAKAASFKVEMTFYLPVAQSLPTGQKNRLLWGFSNHNTKPDLSNLVKFYEDCLTGVIFSDDALISNVSACKRYSSQPRTEIKIMPCEEISLENEATEILSIISPKEVSNLVYDVMYLKDLLTVPESNTSENLTQIAAILSRISKSSAKKLQKIAKIHGSFFEKVDIQTKRETFSLENNQGFLC